MAGYRIWFQMNERDVIELPVNPQDVTITYPSNTTNYDVEGIGEIVIPRIPKLATVTFESFFPREKVYLPMVNDDRWYTPEWYVNFFRTAQKKRIPFELTISRGYDTLYEYDDSGNRTLGRTDYFDTILAQAVLLDFSITDHGGEPGDIYYTMSICEYRDASPKVLAEVAEEKSDEEGNVVEQKMVIVANRPPQSGAIVENRTVMICGKVFELPDWTYDDWQNTRREANQIDRVVTRVLPPEVSNIMHSVYINGLGWVDKSNCSLAEDVGTVNSINRLITNSYD